METPARSATSASVGLAPEGRGGRGDLVQLARRQACKSIAQAIATLPYSLSQCQGRRLLSGSASLASAGWARSMPRTCGGCREPSWWPSPRPGQGARRRSQARSAPRYSTYAELFARDDVDAVVLAARSVDHGRLALEVLRSGKHLFLEKPGATTMEEHDALRRERAVRAGQIVQVGYMRRYDVAFVDAHRRVRGGEAGEPLVVLLTSRDTEWPEGEDPHDTGGFLLDMASHDYDAACWLLGDEAVDVTAARQSLVYPELAGLGDLDNAVVTIRFARGGLAVTHVSRTSPFGHDIRCEVVGTEASIFVRGPGDGALPVVGRGRRSPPPRGLRRPVRRRLRRGADGLRPGVPGRRRDRPDAGGRPPCGRDRHRGSRERRERADARGGAGLAVAVRRRGTGGRVVTALLLLVLAGVVGAAIADSLGTSDSRSGHAVDESGRARDPASPAGRARHAAPRRARDRCSLLRRPRVQAARARPAGARNGAGAGERRLPRARIAGSCTSRLVALAAQYAAGGAGASRTTSSSRRPLARRCRWSEAARRPGAPTAR